LTDWLSGVGKGHWHGRQCAGWPGVDTV